MTKTQSKRYLDQRDKLNANVEGAREKMKDSFLERKYVNQSDYKPTGRTGKMDLKHIDKIRCFKMLKYDNKAWDVILHIPICLEKPTGKSNRDADIECLKKTLKVLTTQTGFKGKLNISVNGVIKIKDDVKYLQTIDDTQIGPFQTIVFQRPNYGYQWGGLYDVWLKHKDVKENKYFATLECDCFLTTNWYKICIKNIKDLGYIGQPPSRDLAARGKEYDISNRLWRNGNDEIISDVEDMRNIMYHTRGGFYFCSRFLLTKMDKVYGYFTPALQSDLCIDGIASGEIGFASRTRQLGFDFKDIDDIVFCCENMGWPK